MELRPKSGFATRPPEWRTRPRIVRPQLVLLVDNAGWHLAKDLQVPANVRL